MTIARALIAQWVAIFFVGSSTFFASVLIARNLSPDLFGVYATVTALGSIGFILMDGGFSRMLLRKHSTNEQDAHHGVDLRILAFTHLLIATSFISLLVMCLFPNYRLVTFSAIVFFFFVACNQFGFAVLKGQGRFLRDSLWQIGNRSSTLLMVGVAVIFGAYLPWQIFIAQALGVFVFWLAVGGACKIPYLRVPSIDLYKSVISFIWFDLATAIYFRGDMVILDFLQQPKSEIGQYGVACRLIEAIILVASPIGIMCFRNFRTKINNAERLVKDLFHATLLFLIAAVLLIVFLNKFSPALINLAYGDDYKEASSLIKILIWSLIFVLPNGVMIQACLALESERKMAWVATISAIVNVAGNLFFVPRYGIVGSAWLAVFTELALFLGLIFIIVNHSFEVRR